MSFLSQREIEDRTTSAQNIILDLQKATPDRVRILATSYASSIGCPKEFFLLPLQSICAHFMGPNSRVEVHTGWSEPVIVWSVVMAHKGQKKSPALACFNHELTKLEEQLCDSQSTQETPPQIFVEHFSFEELHYTMKRNNGRVIGLYDELSLLYEQLDRYKAGHADRKTILSLINGGCWRRNFRSSTSTLHTTCFNLTGFVQPTTVIQLTNSNDDDGFMDRQLYSCPPEVHYDYDEYRQVPADIPKLSQIFAEIDEVHPSGSTYTLSQEAHTEFIATHDSINERIRQQHQHEHDRKSILSKGHGQLLRLAAIYTCMDQVLHRLELKAQNQPIPDWSFEIPVEILKRTKILLDYFIDEKFAILPPPREMNSESDGYDCHRLRRILELPHVNITPALISQSHIQVRKNGRYCRDDALKLMEDLKDLNLALLSTTSGRGRPTTILRKRKLEDLSEEEKDLMFKKIKLDKDKYVA